MSERWCVIRFTRILIAMSHMHFTCRCEVSKRRLRCWSILRWTGRSLRWVQRHLSPRKRVRLLLQQLPRSSFTVFFHRYRRFVNNWAKLHYNVEQAGRRCGYCKHPYCLPRVLNSFSYIAMYSIFLSMRITQPRTLHCGSKKRANFGGL